MQTEKLGAPPDERRHILDLKVREEGEKQKSGRTHRFSTPLFPRYNSARFFFVFCDKRESERKTTTTAAATMSAFFRVSNCASVWPSAR